jgi:hypothetical protein
VNSDDSDEIEIIDDGIEDDEAPIEVFEQVF